MNNEKLIEFVREYQFLYDLSNKGYSDNQKKDAAWREIANKLQVDEKDCKKSWFLLRDAFRRAIKKKKETKSGQASSSLKKWKYEDEMSFLLPYMKDRPTICTLTAVDENIEGNLSDGDVEQQNSESTPHVSTIGQPCTLTRVLKRQRTIKQRTNEETPSTAFMKYILENKKTNDIDQFFAGIATTVQSFPIKDRAIAKARVFEIISKMEIDILNRPSTSSSTSPTFGFSNDSNSCPQTPTPEQNNDFYDLSPQTPLQQPQTLQKIYYISTE